MTTPRETPPHGPTESGGTAGPERAADPDGAGPVSADDSRLTLLEGFEQSLMLLTRELLAPGERDLYQRVLERAVAMIPGASGGSILTRGQDGLYTFEAAVRHDLATLRTVTFHEAELEIDGQDDVPLLLSDILGQNRGNLDPTRRAVIERASRTDEMRSTMVVPARAAGELAAVLYLDSALPAEEFERARHLAELFGTQVALVMQRERLRADARRAELELRLLDRVRGVARDAADLHALFDGFVAALHDLLGFEHVDLLLVGDGGLVPHTVVGEEVVPVSPPLASGVVGRVLRTGEGALVPDVAADPDYLAVYDGVLSQLCVPLRDGGALVGLLNIETTGRRLTDADLTLVTAVSDHLGRALERERLYQETRRSERRLRDLLDGVERSHRELDLLHRVRSALSTELDEDRLVAAVTEAVAATLGYTQVSIYFVRDDALVLSHQIGYARFIERLPLAVGVMGRVARTGRATLLPDVKSDPDFVGALEDIRSEVCVPLRVRGAVVGVLNVESVTDRPLGEADLRLVSAVAEYLGSGLERARLHREVREQGARYRLLADHMSELVCLHALDGRYEYLSPSVRARLGHDPADLLGRLASDFLHPDDPPGLLRDPLVLAAREGRSTHGVRVRLRGADGTYTWFESSITPIFQDGQVARVLSVSRDISERRRAEAHLAWSATHDDLTGLPNRRHFEERLRVALREAQAPPSAAFAVLFLDMDRFKVVNDSLGHRVGDELLVAFARRLRAVVPERLLVARLGGDEFAVLVDGDDALERARRIAEGLSGALAVPFSVAGRELRVSASVGIAPGHGRYQDAQDILRDADVSMYRAKRRGGRTFSVFDETMHEQALRRLTIEADLPRALAAERLHLAFQPIVALRDGRLRGFEALVRWTHPVLGPLHPQEFVAVAEESGLIVDLGEWVLRAACRQARAWQDRFGRLALDMHVNVSPQQFELPGLAASVERALSESGCEGALVHLEITESALMRDDERSADTLARLKALGTHVQVDDFGTGYSSLASLHRFPIDALKIDRSFVARLGEDAQSGSIVETIVALARALRLSTVAEGVETADQRQRLLDLGCESGQGFLFAPPLDPGEAETWLARESG